MSEAAKKSDQQNAPERARRNRTLKKGIVSFRHQTSERNCVVHEISESGALLSFEDGASLPMNFSLVVELDGFRVPCRWVRRTGGKVAVVFTGEREQIGASRKQSVQAGFQPADILRQRSGEIGQIAENMRKAGGTSRHHEYPAERPLRPAKAKKSFGALK